MRRIPEPELMDEPAQALAYARADFAEPHQACIDHYLARLGREPARGRVLDLGCGPGDITRRLALALPGCHIDAIDGARAMLALAREDTEAAGLADRIAYHQCRLPADPLPGGGYDAVVSNSLLHHLAEPLDLWRAVRAAARPGAAVFVMDLARPDTREKVETLVAHYAEGEPEILRRDFEHSLHAAYRPEEVRAQCGEAGLELRVETVSDRHWIAWGRLDEA